MFLSKKVRGLFHKGKLSLLTDTAGDTHRMMEATWVIEPLSNHLARELGDEIYNHLFDENGAVRQELEKVELRVGVGLQRVTVFNHQELQPSAVLGEVSVKNVKAERVEDGKSDKVWIRLSISLVFELVGKDARNFAIDQFGNIILLDFEAKQRPLPMEPKSSGGSRSHRVN